MLKFSAAEIYLCLEATDMRKSSDLLTALVREHLQRDPQSATWFVFRGKQGNRLKILYWDRDGYALWHERVDGPRAEQLDPRQLFLFEAPSAEDITPLSPPPPDPEVLTTTVTKNAHGRRKLPETLKRETEIIDVPEPVKQARGAADRRRDQ